MEFTTHFELNSQTARLFGRTPYTATAEASYGVVTLYDPEFDPSYPRRAAGNAPLDYNSSSTECQHDLQFELFPLHSQLLGESLLVSFPPLINMLKSSGSSYLISGPIVSTRRQRVWQRAGGHATHTHTHAQVLANTGFGERRETSSSISTPR